MYIVLGWKSRDSYNKWVKTPACRCLILETATQYFSTANVSGLSLWSEDNSNLSQPRVFFLNLNEIWRYKNKRLKIKDIIHQCIYLMTTKHPIYQYQFIPSERYLSTFNFSRCGAWHQNSARTNIYILNITEQSKP